MIREIFIYIFCCIFTILVHLLPTRSFVEPFYFGPAPAPASQDGGSGSDSSSSSSPVVRNFLQKIFLNKNFTLIYRGLFYSKKGTSALLCSFSTLFK